MKVLFINTFCGIGSTGRIAADMLDIVKKKGGEGKIVYGVGSALRVDEGEGYLVGGKRDYYTHNILSRLTDREGCYSKKETKKLLAFIDEYKPDVIHLHNLHGHYLNYSLLFSYLAGKNIKVIWTFHDCWPITGHCTHFAFDKCSGWKEGCISCRRKNTYPKSYFISRSQKNFIDKQKAFCSVRDMTIVTPSKWLAGLVKESFLAKYPVKVINNGIDLDVFRPHKSDFRARTGLEGKKLILGIAGEWGERKGLNDFMKLADMLDSSYSIILVGLSGKQISDMAEKEKNLELSDVIDKKIHIFERKQGTEGISKLICVTKTNNVDELAEIYSTSDVFVNPTYEDNFPTVNIEALACGTPVVSYDTGGSPESLDESCGIVCPQGNVAKLAEGIEKALDLSPEDACRRAQLYSKTDRYTDYYRLYCER